MKKTLLILMAAAFQLVSWGQSASFEDGAEFTAKTTEGIEMMFKVISAKDKTCQVGRGRESYEAPSSEFAAIETGTVGTVTIPKLAEGYTVTAIGSDAFFSCTGITKVIIPETVTSIGQEAFQYCYGLTSFTIPKSVTYFGGEYEPDINVFAYCEKLEKLTVEAGNPVYDSRNNCNAIIKTATNTLIAGCNATVIPSTVTTLRSVAFCGSGIQSVNIPKGVKEIGTENPFMDCAMLASITVEAGNPVYDSRNNCNAIIETKTNTLVAGCSKTAIPETVRAYGVYAFTGISLAKITLSKDISFIANLAFYRAGLKSITSKIAEPFPVYRFTFYQNGTFPTLYVPKGTKELYANTEGWNMCEEIIETDDAPMLPTYADGQPFYYATSDSTGLWMQVLSAADKTCQAGMIVNGYNSYDKNCEALCIIPSVASGMTVTTIGSEAFSGSYNMKEVVIPATVEQIGNYAFFCCNLAKVTVLASVPPVATDKSLRKFATGSEMDYPTATLYVPYGTKSKYETATGWNLFSNIVEMEPETFSESGVTYEQNAEDEVAFVGDSSAKSSYEIPATVNHDGKEYKVTAIAADAFKGDEALTSVMIPEGVDVIGAGAFAGCKNLADIFVKAEKPATIAAALSRGLIHKANGQTVDTFDGVDKTTCVLHVLAQSLELYRQAEGWKEFQHIVAFDPVGISNTSAAATSFDVYTTAGVLVRQQTTTTQGLPAGVYIVNGRKMVVK